MHLNLYEKKFTELAIFNMIIQSSSTLQCTESQKISKINQQTDQEQWKYYYQDQNK